MKEPLKGLIRVCQKTPSLASAGYGFRPTRGCRSLNAPRSGKSAYVRQRVFCIQSRIPRPSAPAVRSFPFPYQADRESADFLRVPSGGASSPCLAAQQKADTVDVQGDHGEGDDAGKAHGASCQNPVEAAVLEVVDRRFHCRMLTSHRHEFFAPLALPLSLVQVAFLRQHVVIEQFVEADSVLGAVKAVVEAHCAEIGKPLLASLDHGSRSR